MKKDKSIILRKVLTISLAAAMLMGTGVTTVGSYIGTSISASAANDSATGYYYDVLDDGTVKITGYFGNKARVVIPSTIDGKTVTVIDNAFHNNTSITSVVIPNTVKKLEDSYYACGAFQGCTSLLSVTIAGSVEYLGDYSFDGCSSLVNLTIGNGVKEIGKGVFHGCTSLKKVTIPSSVEFIDDCAFERCSALQQVYIGSGLNDIKDNVFYSCDSLENINVDEENPYYCSQDGVLFDKDMLMLIKYPIGNTRNEYTVPDGVVNLGANSFQAVISSNLESLILSESVSTINTGAFYGNYSIKRFVIEKGLKKTLTSYGAFNYNGNIYYTGNYNQWNNIDGNIFSSEKVHYNYVKPSTSKTGICGTNVNYSLLDSGELIITPKQNIKSTDVCLMYGYDDARYTPWYSGKFEQNENDNVKSLTILEGITEIGNYDFQGCNQIESVDIPSGVTRIGKNAFAYCTALSTLTLPSSLKEIDESAFENINIENLVIPEGTTTIGESAFRNNKELEYVTIPASVTEIGADALEGCDCLVAICGVSNSVAESYAKKNNIAFIASAALENGSQLTADTVSYGSNVGVLAYASGGSGSYRYKIEYKKTDDSTWTVVQNFKERSVQTFKTKDAGEYQVRITVRDSVGTEEVKIYSLTVEDTFENRSSVDSKKIVLGNTVNITAASSGGTGECTYAVYYKKSTDKNWVTKQNFSTNTKVSIKPAMVADYDILVKVKDSSGRIVDKSFTVNVGKALTNDSQVSAEYITLGDTVKVTAAASGGTSGYTYAVYYKKTIDKNWVTKQNFSSNSALSIKPAMKATYEICVKVKDNSGTVSKKYFTVTVK